ncbi:MAG: hypothetical protein ACK5OX_08140 [Desertimonas sp.]
MKLRTYSVVGLLFAATAMGPGVPGASAAGPDEQPGEWVDVTPPDMGVVAGTCDSYGVASIAVDPVESSDVYAMSDCFGIWRSSDHGLTWSGPIETGRNGRTVRDCAGVIAVVRGQDEETPTILRVCIRGEGMGFWRSVDGGVAWQQIPIPLADRQDYSTITTDPYDPDHVLITGHEMNVLAESTDRGLTWREIPMARGMQAPGSASMFFVDTGDASKTARTWLYTPQWDGGEVGTWRTEDAGETWVQVDTFEKPHGMYQIFQSDDGVMLAGGLSGSDGDGIYRSDDEGETWDLVAEGYSSAIWGASERRYSAYSWACGDCEVDAEFRSAPADDDTDWSDAMDQPAAMRIGPAAVAVVDDGDHEVFISANWRDGVWRYVEDAPDD